MPSSTRLERRVFALLTALAAAIVVALPIVPGHDVPQHLAYVRLLTMWRHDPSSLPAVYAAPDMSSGYVTAYALLVRLSAFVSPEVALRLAIAAYVVLLAIAVRALVHATWREKGPTTLLGPLVALNPVLVMGLVAYLFAMPALVGAFAALVAYARSGARRTLGAVAALAAATAALHSVAAAALLLLGGVFFVARRDRRSGVALVVAIAGALVGSRLAGASTKVPPGLGALLVQYVHEYGVVDGTLGTFRITFTPWLEKVEVVYAAIVGPFPFACKLLIAAILALVVVVDWRLREPSSSHALRGVRPAVLALAVAAILAPAALQVPDDLSLIDFRLITTAITVGVVLVPPGLLRTGRVWVFAGAVAALLLLWQRQLAGAAGELMQTVRLTGRLAEDDVVLALSMHDESAYPDEGNEVLHYGAVYHTARTGGVTSMFWGKFSPRLPVGYQPGRGPPAPGDWTPWDVTDEQMTHYTHLLVRWPSAGDDPRLVSLAARVTKLESEGALERVATDGSCELFSIAAVSRATTERRAPASIAIRP